MKKVFFTQPLFLIKTWIFRRTLFRLDESTTFQERGRFWEAPRFLHFNIFFDSVLGGCRPHFLRFWSVPGASKFDPFLEKWCSRRGETPLREKPRFFIKNPPLPKNMEKLSKKSLKSLQKTIKWSEKNENNVFFINPLSSIH